MPELPDVKVFRRHIHTTSLGQKVAAVHAPSLDLSDSALRKLYETMHTVLQTAIDKGAQPDKLPHDWLLYAKSQGKRQCPACGGNIEKLSVGGRSAHFCPSCQKQ